jgi:hypothetical protein
MANKQESTTAQTVYAAIELSKVSVSRWPQTSPLA